jgi:molybdopterin/thiamine biosynthesis adenylyltransferase
MSSISKFHRQFTTKPLNPLKDCSLTDRQERLAGFDQRKYAAGHFVVIGAGGLGGIAAWTLARKGARHITIVDMDKCEPSNSNRQFFVAADFFKPKAFCLSKNIAPFATGSTRIDAYALSFQELAAAKPAALIGDVALVLVDNNQARRDASAFYRKHKVPVVFAAVDHEAMQGWVFVQDSGKACLGCKFPTTIQSSRRAPCRTPACADPLLVCCGLVAYGVDSLLMPGRRRLWNYSYFCLSGAAPSASALVERNSDCPLCSP